MTDFEAVLVIVASVFAAIFLAAWMVNRDATHVAPRWSRLLCFLGFHPYDRLTDEATCADCGRFVL